MSENQQDNTPAPRGDEISPQSMAVQDAYAKLDEFLGEAEGKPTSSAASSRKKMFEEYMKEYGEDSLFAMVGETRYVAGHTPLTAALNRLGRAGILTRQDITQLPKQEVLSMPVTPALSDRIKTTISLIYDIAHAQNLLDQAQNN